MIRGMNTLPELDTHEFTRRGQVTSGTRPLTDLPRLGSLLMDLAGALDWQIAGRSDLRADGSRMGYLELTMHAQVTMRCVRCLEALSVELDEARSYRLVADEAQALREDAEDDEHDLLVGSRHFDLASLIEDEAIMALPAAPRHDNCAAPIALAESSQASDLGVPESESEPEGGANPFAALAAMRRKPQ